MLLVYCLNGCKSLCTYAILFLVFSFVSFFVVSVFVFVFVVDAAFYVFFFAFDLQNINVNEVKVASMIPCKIR